MNKFKRYSLILIFTMFLACSHDYVTGKSSYNWFKIEKDISLGVNVLDSQTKELKSKKKPVDPPNQQANLQRIQTIVTNIAKVSHLPHLPYEVHIADVKVVNAWAAPGGKMMVFTGLWDKEKGLVDEKNDEELAAVLAHEIAHTTARHVTESLSQNLTIALAGAAVSSAIAAGGSSQGSNLFNEIFSTGFKIYAPSYSRKNEAEADLIGLFYMAKAGYDPRVALRVWKRAAQKRGDKTSIYASHPSNGERAKKIEQVMDLALKIYHHPSLPYPDFANLHKK